MSIRLISTFKGFPDPAKQLAPAKRTVQGWLEADFKSHTQHYSGSVDIETQDRGSQGLVVGSSDMRLVFVSKGTRPHRIAPRNAPALAFQTGYRAKTTPSAIPSRSGGAFGPTVFVSRAVQHPGIKARNVDSQIADKRQPQVVKLIRGLIDE